MKDTLKEIPPVLVLGGGAAGQRTAVDLVNTGLRVILAEKGDTLGGTAAQLGTMFPQHNCLLCRGDERHGNGCTRPGISAELLDFTKPDTLSILTRTTLAALERSGSGLNGRSGKTEQDAGFRAVLRTEPRYIEPDKCIVCGRCSEACPQTLPDLFQAGLTERKAVYLPSERCIPDSYAVTKGSYCEGCGKCADVCPTDAVNLNEKPEEQTVDVSAVVLATGLGLYDPSLSEEYGYGRYANVVSGLEMERMTSPAGPGEGRILRRSDGTAPGRIAWLQCIGSRDQEHDYCSSFCCSYATRQAVIARQLLPETQAAVFMMDDRVFARGFSGTYDPLRKEYGIVLQHCRLSVLREDPGTKDIILQVYGEDGRVTEERFGMVVLSIGAEAAENAKETASLLGIETDNFGFVRTETLTPVDTGQPGVFTAGSASGPADLADSVTGGSAAAARVCEYLQLQQLSEQAEEETAVPADEDIGSGCRIGVFACDCAGEIGNTVNLSDVLGRIGSRPEVEAADIIPFGCLPEGMDEIRKKIEENDITHAVIGACKRRTYGPLFTSRLPVPVRFVSLREECSYVHRDDPAGATGKAFELLRMGTDRAVQDAVQPLPVKKRIVPEPRILVLGGGLAGMTAALHAADAGAGVTLVEREEQLGGNALKLNRTPEGADVPALIGEMSKRVTEHPSIEVFTGAEVIRQVSDMGVFTSKISEKRPDGREVMLRSGAVIVATGGEEFRGNAFGLNGSPEGSGEVITLLDLGMRLRSEPDMPKKLKQAVFISCFGPWNEPGSSENWRCSRNCCETMVRQARALRESNPGCRVAVLMREINTYSFREEDYTAARKAGVLFVRFDPALPPQVKHRGGMAQIVVTDKSLGEPVEFNADLVVLSAAVMPRRDAEAVAASIEVPLGPDGFFKEWESKTRGYAAVEPGVFVCGLAHGPKPVREVITQALAASQSALIRAGSALEIDPGAVAEVNPGECASCLTCVRCCPYQVPRIGSPGFPHDGSRGKAYIDAARCQGCGTCVSECPAGAISMQQYSSERFLENGILGTWAESGGGVSFPAAGLKPQITVLSCKYCGNVPVELSGIQKNQYPASVKVIDVPCTGLVTADHLLKALEQGADGVLVSACPEGTCHHLTGNVRAGKRVSHVRDLLELTGLDPARLRFANLGIGQGEAFAGLLREMTEEIAALDRAESGSTESKSAAAE